MKSLKITLAAFIIMFTLQSNAQFSINLSLGSRAQYQNHYQNQYRNNDDMNYYYLPEIEAYYEVNSATFIYNSPRGWIRSSNLPEYCRDYDVNRGYKVAINYRGNSPYANFYSDRQKYYRNDNRNYREEYNRGRNGRRNDYVEVSNQNRYNNNDNNRDYYRRENNGNERENRHEDRD